MLQSDSYLLVWVTIIIIGSTPIPRTNSTYMFHSYFLHLKRIRIAHSYVVCLLVLILFQSTINENCFKHSNILPFLVSIHLSQRFGWLFWFIFLILKHVHNFCLFVDFTIDFYTGRFSFIGSHKTSARFQWNWTEPNGCCVPIFIWAKTYFYEFFLFDFYRLSNENNTQSVEVVGKKGRNSAEI